MKRLLFLCALALNLCCQGQAAVDLVGDADDFNCGDITSFDGLSSFTISVWADTDSLALDQQPISKSGAFEFYIDTLGAFGSCVYTDSGVNFSCKQSNNSSVVVANGVQNLVIVWNGGTNFDTYVNGVDSGEVDVATSGTPTTLDNSSGSLRLGSISGTGQFYNGQIYQIDVWNAALTSTQVLNYYNQRSKLSAYNVKQGSLLFSWGLMEKTSGTGISGVNAIDSVTGLACSGIDADADSSYQPETTLNFQGGLIQ